MRDTLTARQNIRYVLSGEDLEYFDRLCTLEDADENDAIEQGRRYSALDAAIHAAPAGQDKGTVVSTLDAAKAYLAFLRGE